MHIQIRLGSYLSHHCESFQYGMPWLKRLMVKLYCMLELNSSDENRYYEITKGEVGVIQRRRAAVSVSTLRNDVKRSV